uniref:DNA2/NAM7 helicase-like C-terminal domain-containing protein n=1 Tax=Ditylum brightwellii TaxID=49249 RepID=A0A7S4W6P6_9STRA
MTMMTRIGTVDSYQGQEQDYVILSATRSNANGSLGFLFDPRRLNVAITRSKQGLIIVGDGRSLSHSRHWRALFEFCKDRGCVLDADELRDYYNCT